MIKLHKKSIFNSTSLIVLATVLGLLSAWLNIAFLNQASHIVADIFIRLLKLVSLPIIFFSLVSTLSGMGGVSEVRILAGKVLRYTLLTTLIAATMALLLYTLLNPVDHLAIQLPATHDTPSEPVSYWHYLLSIIPSNIIDPFYNNNVLGVLFIALLFSASILALNPEHKNTLHHLFDSLFAAVMKMTGFILKLMPLAVWAFITQFAHELEDQQVMYSLTTYLLCIMMANLLQGLVVLPLFLKTKGIPPWKALKAMWPALTVAFFSKSSSAALPSAVECAQNRLGVDSHIARFSMPLCITINMNACAAFILITVLFVSQSNGVEYSAIELVSWIFIATLAAIGNAGVPMGCYMLSSAFLSAMGVPLQLLVIILPFYALIDMIESALNVWSDACVTAMVDQDLLQNEQTSSSTREVS